MKNSEKSSEKKRRTEKLRKRMEEGKGRKNDRMARKITFKDTTLKMKKTLDKYSKRNFEI